MMGSSPPSRWGSEAGLGSWPLSARLFIGLFLGVLGLAYAAFLAQIAFDTEMRLDLIAEAYRDMGLMEFSAHSFRYLAWFCTTFGITVGVFLFSRFPESLKRFFSVWTPFWIIADLASTWLIRFSDFFAAVLFVSGVSLAMTFALLYVLIQYDLWSAKAS